MNMSQAMIINFQAYKFMNVMNWKLQQGKPNTGSSSLYSRHFMCFWSFIGFKLPSPKLFFLAICILSRDLSVLLRLCFLTLWHAVQVIFQYFIAKCYINILSWHQTRSALNSDYFDTKYAYILQHKTAT